MILASPARKSMIIASITFVWCVASQAQSPSTTSNNAVDDAVAEEIIVLGRKAETTKVKIRINTESRRVSCKITKSSGDKAVDGTVCEAVRFCAGIPKLTPQKLDSCLNEKGPELRRALAIRRADR
jgi:TonB C terminal